MALTFILFLLLSSLKVVFSISCECSNCDKCQGNLCIDLIEDGIHHHWMSLTSTDNAYVERGDGASWTCTCNGCSGLEGNWNCPNFYDSNIIITSQTQDITTPEFTNNCNGQTCVSQICYATQENCAWVDNYACIGTVIGDYAITDKDECISKCKDNVDCKCITWLKDTPQTPCRLETGPTATDRGANAPYQALELPCTSPAITDPRECLTTPTNMVAWYDSDSIDILNNKWTDRIG
eukprot:417166_1